jgi:hypothetical protein
MSNSVRCLASRLATPACRRSSRRGGTAGWRDAQVTELKSPAGRILGSQDPPEGGAPRSLRRLVRSCISACAWGGASSGPTSAPRCGLIWDTGQPATFSPVRAAIHPENWRVGRDPLIAAQAAGGFRHQATPTGRTVLALAGPEVEEELFAVGTDVLHGVDAVHRPSALADDL